ncbi:hypothetical protein PIB30_057140 [Stylosanthes scabra]|uniref:Uncharacterized protein n=1 Tax=Stylosanthes scabra TaxID=79078 RepID=A0ABU6ULL3_9FABA|nr:hypothetical protein [Stylosanthes scabra]
MREEVGEEERHARGPIKRAGCGRTRRAATAEPFMAHYRSTAHRETVLYMQMERVLLPRRCAFMMSPPAALLQYIKQAGFEHAVQLMDFCFDAALISVFVER